MSTCYTHGTIFMTSTPSTKLTDKLHTVMNFLVFTCWYEVINFRNVLLLSMSTVTDEVHIGYLLFYITLHSEVQLSAHGESHYLYHYMQTLPTVCPFSSLAPKFILQHPLKFIYLSIDLQVRIHTSGVVNVVVPKG